MVNIENVVDLDYLNLVEQQKKCTNTQNEHNILMEALLKVKEKTEQVFNTVKTNIKSYIVGKDKSILSKIEIVVTFHANLA